MPQAAGIAVLILAVLVGFVLWRRKRARNFLEAHSIGAEQLHELLFADEQRRAVHVIDVRLPLDLLAYSQIIPGARRIAPQEIIANPGLIPKDTETVVYCTCPSDDTARKIVHKAVSLGFDKVRILHGGLDAWKEKSYPVEAYETAFHLDTPL
jgi:rhodanese-related sulfurtransferase